MSRKTKVPVDMMKYHAFYQKMNKMKEEFIKNAQKMVKK